ncbi:MAG TPA: phosphatase PAP2 family protein [Bacillota bacterium]|nr:phosphatase PAP2 family protein [Bacillota bacterium]HPQ61711.1 phosphatase PAP2 family protein [Bacillota bacterium]
MPFEVEIIKWFQSFRNGFWDLFFQLWTMFGEELVIVGILGFMFWCLDKKRGEAIGITVFASLIFNSALKGFVQRIRPYDADADIVNVRSSTTDKYSFPSGHTQGAATTFFSLSTWMKKHWLTILSIVVVIMVMLSRMYLGAHYLTDVIAGGLLGLAFAIGFYYLFQKVKNRALIYWVTAITSIVLVVASYLFYIISMPSFDAAMQTTDADYVYYGLVGLFKMTGAMLGFVLGISFEKKRVNFENHRVIWKNIIRFALGVAIVMGVRYVLKYLFGFIVDSSAFAWGDTFKATIALILDMIRYLAMVFIGIGVYPLLFKKVKI